MADWKESARKSVEIRTALNPETIQNDDTFTNIPTRNAENLNDWREQAKKSLASRGYVVTGGKPDVDVNKDDKKKENSNPIFKRYNIDPDNFTLDDLDKWAKSHNFEVRQNGEGFYYAPKYEGGFLGFGGKKKTTDEEDEALKTLKLVAENNERKKTSDTDIGKIGAAVIDVGDGISFGAMKGAMKLGDKITKKQYEKLGLDENTYVPMTDTYKKTVENHPIANALGNIAGSTVSLGMLSEGVNAATKGVSWIAKMPQWVQSAINSGITFSVASGAETAFDGGNFKDVVKNASINLLGGAVGGGLSSEVGAIGEKILFDKGLQHKIIPEIVRNGLSSAVFASGKTASTYFLYPKDYRPTAEEMAKDIGTAFAFGAISSGINAMKASAQNKKYLDELYQKMSSDYEKMAKINISSKSDTSGIHKFAKNVIGYGNAMEAYLTGKEFSATIDGNTYTFTPNKIRLVGQDKYVKSILKEIQTIRNNANAALNGVGTPSTDLTTKFATSAPSSAASPAVIPTLPSSSEASAPVSPIVPTASPNTAAKTSVAPVVDTSVSAKHSGRNVTDEINEIANSEPIKMFAPKTANSDIKKLENILIAQGSDDASRQEIVATAVEVEKTLAGTGKTIRSVFDDTAKITSGAVSEIKNKTGASGAFWKLFGENFKAIPSGNVTNNIELIKEYTTAYTQALKNSNPQKYNSVMLSADGTDLAAELPQTIMQNIIPANVQNAGEYQLAAAHIKNIISDVGIRIGSERAKIYGANAKTAAPIVENAKGTFAEEASSTASKNVRITQVGDFYEAYGNDAVELARKLNLTPTTKTINGVKMQMVGFPVSSLDRYKNILGSNYNISVSDTPGVTSINEQNMPVSNENTPVNEDVTNIDVDMADGEILSLKHTKNVYSLFKGAVRVIVGKDVISDGFVAIPLTDEALTKVKKVAGDVIQDNPNFELSKIYHKDNDVLIQGNPKTDEISAKKKVEKAYVFKIGNAFYTCQQKYIDAFNNGKNVITANKRVSVPWTVHNENGEFVALFSGADHAMNDERFNSLQYVSKIKTAEQQKKADNAAKPFNQNEIRLLFKEARPYFFNANGSTYVGNNSLYATCDADAVEFLKTEYRSRNTNSNYEIEFSDSFGSRVEKLLSDAVTIAEASKPISHNLGDKDVSAYIVGDYAIAFDKNYANFVKKRSATMKIVSEGNLATTLLVGYDEDGNITAFALPILAQGEVAAKNGAKYPFATANNIKKLVKDAKDSVSKAPETVTETPESVKNTADTVSDETIEIETKLFNNIVDEVENDDTVSGKKGKHYYVSKHTPEIIVKKADIEDLPMIISFETLYLAVRENGELKGHYHGLGASNTKKLYKVLSDPTYILKNNENGRINIISDIAIGKNNKSVISIELDVYKNVEGVKNTKHKGNYNLVITLFSAKDNYAENLKNKQEMSVLYEKKEDTHSSDLTSENMMLGNTENVSSVDNSVSQNNDVVNNSVRNNTENDTLNLTDKCELITTKHTATGNDIWVVTLKDRISSDEYKDLRDRVKAVGGYYSRYAKTPDGKAIPGFVFKTEPTSKEIKVFNDFFDTTEENTPYNTQDAEHISTEAKPDLQVGDVIELNGKKWRVAQTGFNMTFENLDKNDKESVFSHIGGMENFKNTQDYTIVSKKASSEVSSSVEKNITETQPKNEDVLKNEPDNAIIKSKGTKQIADYVADKLAKGEKITALELSKISSQAFGGTMANNTYSIKDAYDAMELGVNKHILSMKDVSAEKMLKLLELLPTQTKRTEEMVRFQQFSTPPSIAYLANYAANISAKDIMLEPSAGIGGIAVFAKKDGAKVYVNELDGRRLDILKNMPFDGFFNENAEQLDNILGGEIEPTVIVMNPPFSSSSERNIQNTKIGAKHIEQALKILAPNGRLVAIVGHGMGDGAPAFRSWWKDIKSQYNVKANIRINGKNYNKYGTNFDIQMLVIDKNGTTTKTETGYVNNLQELQEKLEVIRNERPLFDYSGNEQRTPATTRSTAVKTRKENRIDTGRGNAVVSDGRSIADSGKQSANVENARINPKESELQNFQQSDGQSGTVADRKSQNADVVASGQGIDGRGNIRRDTGLQNSGRIDGTIDVEHSEQSGIDRSNGTGGTGRNNGRVQRPRRKELTDSIFEQYQTQPLKVKNAQPHPAKVSESAAMSAIEPPAITYKPNLPQEIIDSGVLSDVQLEAISYAGQSHSQVLPNGNTRGFFLGDGTGIGKGRTIAGMILDNYNQGRKKSLWVTLNSSLVNDAKRDIKAVFGNSDLVTQFVGGKKADSVLSKDETVMVISYTALSTGFDNTGSNFEKIVNWLGKDFDGLIVFDEAHKMGNATATKGTRGVKKPSQTGLAGIALQEALPKAKVVYSSATGATEVENLRYAERLGLWGEGTAFVTGDDFVSKIKAGGLAAMELIARDMKAMGVYLSRNISYEDVRYDKITHKLTREQKKIYDELARSWQIVLNNINKALESTNQNKSGKARGNALGAFWSSQQRFFNQILTSMQVPSVISDIEKQLADGKSCVIQLVSTNEAAQNEEFERIRTNGLDLDEFDLTPKQMLMSYIENSFPVQQFEEYRDDEGNVRSKPVYDSKGNPVLNRDAVKQREELLAKLGSIKVPSSPIDMIINHFGTDLVAENTGRARRVIQKDGKFIEEKIGSKKDADVDAFQNGNKRIIIFSKAGGTGKSYHADRAAKNQQQRVHYLLEAGWQADNAVQGFGRSHRSNQASAPIFKLVTTDLKGQMRFISTIAKRLDQLGAMTKGQRQAGGQGMFSASDNLENSFAADVLAVFYKDLVANRVDGIDDGLAIIEKLGLKEKIIDDYNCVIATAPELREVNKFLNRILSLESSEQNTVFDGYSERLQDATEKAMLAGTLDKGLENYKADRITLNEVQDIREDERSGAKTKYYNLTAEHKINPVKFEDIRTDSKSFVGFYQNKSTGAVRAVVRTSSTTDQYGNVTDNFKLIGQVKNDYIAQNRFYGNWFEIEPAEAEKLWNEELSKLPKFRKENLHLISGVVLPVWDKLPTENVRIYRVLTSDGEMLIGRVVSEDMIDETLRRLGSSRIKEKIATKDLIAGIKSGDTVHLENNWKIVQRKVSGENRIEIVGPSYEHYDLLTKKGVFTERIQYNTRYFVPADTDTEKIIDEILKLSPVMRVENAKYSAESEEINDEQAGNLLSDGNGGRPYSASAKRKTKRLDGRSSRYREGRTAARERREYCKTLKASGNTEQKVIYGHKCEVIPDKHYTPRMTKIAEQNKKDGIDETVFVTGKFTIPFVKDKNGNPKKSKGVYIKANGKKVVIVQYDNEFYLPEQINDHEKIHDRYHTALVTKAKNIIMNSLSVAEKKKVIDKLTRDYNGIIEDNEEEIIEEFVANVLSDMDYEYLGTFEELQRAYWNGDEKFIDNYKVSEYSESIDAGGTNADLIDNVGFGNDYRLTESFGDIKEVDNFEFYDDYGLLEGSDLNDGENTETLEENGMYGGNDSLWQQSNGSYENYERLEGLNRTSRISLEKQRGFVDWGRKLQSNGAASSRTKERTYGILREISKRRIADVDSVGRKLSAAVKKYFSNTVFKNKNGELIPMFHATDNEFNIFKFGDFGFHIGSAEQAINRGGKYIKELYANITNPLYIPADRGIWTPFVVADEARRQGIITQGEYDIISKTDGFHKKDYNSRANSYLRKLLKAKEYDGIIYPNEFEGDGISGIAFDSNQLKYISNKNPSKAADIRYSLTDIENDIAELTPERKKQIFEQFDKDRAEIDKPTQKQLWGERAAWVAHNMTRVFPNIPERGEKGTFFAEFRKSMIQWKNLPTTASFMVQDKLNKMTDGLTPDEFKTFSELVYFLDLQEEAQIQKERGYDEILLPNEITPREVDEIVKVLNDEATDKVQQALIKRQNIWEALKTQYIDLNRYIGFDTDGKFKRKNYYHHQVIDYMSKGSNGTGSSEIGIKAGRGWLKERQGSTKAINTDFLAVEYKAMLQMQYDVYIAETLGKIKQKYDIKPQLENEAFRNNKNALNEIIKNEATDKNGNVKLDSKGKPDSETYRQKMWYNSRIMFGFDGLFDLAERNELPTYDGEYARVVEALKRHDLNVPGLYRYVGIIASADLPDNATDAQEQAALNARTVLKYTSQKREWIKSVLDDNYQTWETIAKSMSDTHTIYQPRRGNYFYTKTVVDEDAFNKAYNEMVLSLTLGEIDLGNVDLNKLFTQYADTVRLTGAAYEQWVLPNEIVTTMDEIANPKQVLNGTKIARGIVSAWKGWATSVNPLRTVKFGLRNLIGDLDAVIAGNPKVTMYSKKAVQDIYQAMRYKNYSDDFMEWVKRGGYTSMIFANEMDTEMQDKLFSHLKEKQGISIFKIPAKAFEKYYNGVENVHNFREAILRYSAYLYFKEAIKRNGGVVKDYVASNKYIVRGLNSIEDKAYQLSKDLLGAYDEVGKLGQTLRRYWIPFYSFTETNLKRYYRLFENIITSDDKISKKAGKLLLKALMVNMLGLLMVAWNKLVMKEQDDKLPPSVRNVPHITLGQIGDNVYAFRQLGSFSELLEWFGLDDYKLSSEDLAAPLDKAWGMVTPFLKMPIELVSGLNFYPSLAHPRAIRDKWQHFFNSFGVDDIYSEVTGKPTKGIGEILKGAVVYNYDYKESAYYEILDIKREYQGKTDNTIYGTNAKSNALYYMKTAVRYKDKEAALKYLDKYFENGGTAKGIKQSFATLNPMYGFTSKDTAEKGEAFIASLTEDEKEKLKIAQDFYENDLMLPQEVLSRLGKKDITEEEAKNLLRNYINAKCK